MSGMLVVNYQDYKNRYLKGKNKEMAGIYPEIIGTSLSSDLAGTEIYTQRASLIGRATYGYGNRYFIEGSFRVDGSTKFHPDNRWGFSLPLLLLGCFPMKVSLKIGINPYFQT